MRYAVDVFDQTIVTITPWPNRMDIKLLKVVVYCERAELSL